MNKEETKKMIEEYLQAYDTGDYKMTLEKYYTEDAVFENTRVRVVGRDNCIQWFTKSHALGYMEKLTPVNILIGEGVVAVELDQEFTAYEDVPNHYVAPMKKGETITTSGVCAFYKMRDGRISSVRVYCTLNAYNPGIFSF